MCGIVGVFDRRGIEPVRDVEIVGRMADALAHRGPDDRGTWADPAGVAFGHRRLSIIDLSPLGRQPMRSASGRYTIAFNGEIYNFAELRKELIASGQQFRGRSDTEVMLAAFEQHGFVDALPHLRGMFAMAVWDGVERRLFLARDRMGEKPLYYGWIDEGRTLVLGSELKALMAHPRFDARVDRASLISFIRHGYVPAPHSIFQGVHKLPPGTWTSFAIDRPDTAPAPYYSLIEVAEQGISVPARIDLDEAADRLESSLRDAIREQMVADVPVGAFLSGGLDSSTVVALMQAQSSRPVRTFSIGFHEGSHDEAPYARKIAAHLGTDHKEVYVSPADALAVIPALPEIYDEPFADSSQIPTVLVSRIARADVTVSLSGDGGDELLSGYPRYRLLRRLTALMRVPGRDLASRQVHRLLTALDDGRDHPSKLQGRIARARRLTAAASSRDPDELYALMLCTCFEPERFVREATERRGLLPLSSDILRHGNVTERAMLADGLEYLPDDILVKVDRAAMSVGLETRIPMLDPRVVATAWQLPYDSKVRGRAGKPVLARVLSRYVPRSLFDRPKMGFMVPMPAWLRGPLRDWASSLLDEERLRRDGYLDATQVHRRWQAHLAGYGDWYATIWNVLMWQAWHERYRPRS